MRNKIILLVTLLVSTSAFGASEFWGNLKPGPHGVGFQVIEKYDYGRPYKRKRNYDGTLISGERGRPMQINIWYPANTAQPSFVLADYVHLTASEDLSKPTEEAKSESEKRFLQARWLQGVPEEKLKELLTKSTAAAKDAEHATGRFPLILLANSSGLASPYAHFILGEYLASHGYIVASTPTKGAQTQGLSSRETTVLLQDLQFVISALHDYPGLNRDKLALIGFGIGGLGTALLAMHNTDVDAMVSLDSFLANRFGYSLMFQNSLYDPNRLTVPVLHITSQTATEDTDYAFFNAAKFSPARYVKLKGFTSADFSSFAMLKSMVPLPPPENGSHPDFKGGYETIVSYAHHFFNAHLNDDAQSRAFLEKPSTTDLVTLETKKAIKAPPTEQEFVQIVVQQGPDKAAEIQKEFAELVPEYRIYDPDVLFPIAAQYAGSNKTDQAIAVLGLCTVAFPDYWECYDQIGRIQMNAGNKQQAIENLSRSIELNPDNPETSEMLKKLQES